MLEKVLNIIFREYMFKKYNISKKLFF